MKAEALIDEDSDSISPCPPEGFHCDPSKEEEMINEEEEEIPEQKNLPPINLMMKEVMTHTRHFISMSARPDWQLPALDCVARAARLLRPDQ